MNHDNGCPHQMIDTASEERGLEITVIWLVCFLSAVLCTLRGAIRSPDFWIFNFSETRRHGCVPGPWCP